MKEAIKIEDLIRGVHRIYPEMPYPEIWFDDEDGVWKKTHLSCWSSYIVGGNCACNSHDPTYNEELTRVEALAELKERYIIIPSNPKLVKTVRRRVEDALRKTATPEDILEIAAKLNVKID